MVNPLSKAFVELHGGPLDGSVMSWPTSLDCFPVAVWFAMPKDDSEGKWQGDLSSCRYDAFHAFSEGNVLEDGYPEKMIQTYEHVPDDNKTPLMGGIIISDD